MFHKNNTVENKNQTAREKQLEEKALLDKMIHDLG